MAASLHVPCDWLATNPEWSQPHSRTKMRENYDNHDRPTMIWSYITPLPKNQYIYRYLASTNWCMAALKISVNLTFCIPESCFSSRFLSRAHQTGENLSPLRLYTPTHITQRYNVHFSSPCKAIKMDISLQIHNSDGMYVLWSIWILPILDVSHFLQHLTYSIIFYIT